MMITTNFCNIAGMKTPIFAGRLKELREKVGLNQSDLGRAIGVSPQAVQKWEAGLAVPRESKRKQIASALSTSVDELISGTELEIVAESASKKDAGRVRVFPLRSTKGGAPRAENGFIPLISWMQAAQWGPAMGNVRPEEVEDYLRCPFPHGPDAFVLEISGESNFDPMGPKSYAPGDLIYIDPEKPPANRSMVVVRIDQEDRAQLRQLLMDEGGVKLLKVLNPAWPTPVSAMADNCHIVGVVIGKWVPE
ncbi:helix-turn-helix domain-containing protein [Burkholderia cenocepacia]|uniref:LexA family protein n=1 Tax=Burkholderia cenocepacia TaxID=95486 RepID=UPI001BA02CC6|nr:XRE family transcriptional regulator [Burkholderia cenocepacia]MBR8350301.1 helix-turn-helix domain-containing protein [Burkholderia cenocepacia]